MRSKRFFNCDFEVEEKEITLTESQFEDIYFASHRNTGGLSRNALLSSPLFQKLKKEMGF